MEIRQALLARISAFCESAGIGRSEFGRRAVNDRDFVRDLEQGRASLKRIEAAERFMSSSLADGAAPKDCAA